MDQIVIYETENGESQIDVRMENDTVWLSANQMAVLFGRNEKTLRKHINNVFAENELPKENNTHFLRVDGVKQPVAIYSLDVIISVGYRVKSQRGTQFRIWANRVLKNYLVRGYAANQRQYSRGHYIDDRRIAPPGKRADGQYRHALSGMRHFGHADASIKADCQPAASAS